MLNSKFSTNRPLEFQSSVPQHKPSSGAQLCCSLPLTVSFSPHPCAHSKPNCCSPVSPTHVHEAPGMSQSLLYPLSLTNACPRLCPPGEDRSALAIQGHATLPLVTNNPRFNTPSLELLTYKKRLHICTFYRKWPLKESELF